MKFFLISALILMLPSAIFAECRVVEYPDHNEVVCEEAKREATPKQNNSKRIAEIKSAIDKYNSNIKYMQGRLKSEKNDNEINNLFSNLSREVKEKIELDKELAGYIAKDPIELAAYMSKINTVLDDLDKLRQDILAESSTKNEAPKVKISGINVLQTSTGYSYGYFSVKADFDNYDNKPHTVSAKIQALAFNGHVIESVTLYAKLDTRQSKTVATETMISLDKIGRISKWEATDINVR